MSNTPTLLRRLAVMMYESLLLLGVLSVTFVVPHVLLGVLWNMQAPGALMWLHLFTVLGGYFLWFWLHGGQTLAMQTWQIRVEACPPLGPLTWQRALARYVLAWGSVGFLGFGLLWALLDRDGQFLHDRLAGTRLVRLPKGTQA